MRKLSPISAWRNKHSFTGKMPLCSPRRQRNRQGKRRRDRLARRRMPPRAARSPSTESARRIADNARWIAGGVNSNFRLNISPTPLVFERGEGPYLFDADGNRLIDYYLGMGPMILGHSPAAVRAGGPATGRSGHPLRRAERVEAEAARLVCEIVPCAERIRFGSSGSEVVQAAIRLARAATGPAHHPEVRGPLPRLVRQHPVVDGARPQRGRAGGKPGPGRRQRRAGSCRRPTGSRSWAGTISSDSKRRLAREDVAGVIMEAAMCNAGAIHPAPGYLEGARAACSRHGTVLVFDEVITGFRLAPGGAQERFCVTPGSCDLRKGDRQRLPGRGPRRAGRPPRPLRHRRRRAWRHLQRAMRVDGRDRRHPARPDAGALRGHRTPRPAADGTESKEPRRGRHPGGGDRLSRHLPCRLRPSERRRATIATSPGSTGRPTSPSRRRSCGAACARWNAAPGSSPVEHDDGVIDTTLAAVEDAAREVARGR